MSRKKSFTFKATKEQKKDRKRRLKALRDCPIVNGVTKCPPSGSPKLMDYFK